MDETIVEQLCQALELSLSNDNETRRTAENFIFECMDLQGFCPSMLHISTNPMYYESRKGDVAQAAAIQFKNMAEFHWRTFSEDIKQKLINERERIIFIHQEDKEYVYNNILSSLLQVQNSTVRNQLIYAVECIVKIDFPDNWPELIIQIQSFINSENEMMILTGIKRSQLEEIVDNIFPRLEEIVAQIEESNSIKAFDIKWRIADLLYTTNQISICRRYKCKEGFEKLIGFFKYALECIWNLTQFEHSELNLIQKTENTDEIAFRKSRPEWKLNVVAMHFLFRIIQKYGNPNLCEADDKELSIFITNKYNEEFINMAMNIISKSKEYFVCPDLLGYSLKVCSQATK